MAYINCDCSNHTVLEICPLCGGLNGECDDCGTYECDCGNDEHDDSKL